MKVLCFGITTANPQDCYTEENECKYGKMPLTLNKSTVN